MKLEARNRQLESMISERRKNQEKVNEESQCSDAATSGHTENASSDDGMHLMDPQSAQYWPSSGFYSSPYSAFQRYSYFGDLMSTSVNQNCNPVINQNSSPGPATFHSLTSQSELQDRCDRLEMENKQLKKENELLKRQLEMQSQDSQNEDVIVTPGVIVTPKKVEFLKQIASAFEKKSQRSQAGKQKIYNPKPVRLTYGLEESTCSARMPTKPSETETMATDCSGQDVASGTSHWEESVMSSGVKKVQLHPDYEVYLTQGQISQVKQTGAANPRKMTIALLDVLFTKEQLARSSAKGSKKAHNASFVSMPLPGVATQALKEFVLNSFKNDNGEPCLSDPVFNDIINSKCATARRSLNR